MATKAFGGMVIDFNGRAETMEQLFGDKNLTPAEMTKRLWVFVKANGLTRKENR